MKEILLFLVAIMNEMIPYIFIYSTLGTITYYAYIKGTLNRTASVLQIILIIVLTVLSAWAGVALKFKIKEKFGI